MMAAIAAMACAVVIAGCGRGGDAPSTAAPVELRVSAAVSLTESLQQVAAAFDKQHGTRTSLNLAGSNTLAAQILEGAAVDVFISADAAQMDRVEQANHLLAGTRADILSNRLAVIVPPTDGQTSAGAGAGAARSAGTTATAAMAAPADLLRPAIRRLALGDPAAVPAGVYARQYLERANVWAALQPKVVPLPHVRAVVSAVASGAADAGIVYQTDAAASARDVRIAWIVQPADAPDIVYPAAVIRASAHADQARAFVQFLRTPEAAARFTAAGFTPR